ncbi:hypothetical protein HK100_006552 [Physocladia obscura]|uniref:Ureidoglycolate hydrolase n=1 Tax=Physocladia obscura TaxID=109957 RepID=A0AAD5T556_9FUNG|nr:hypothetical protein HK100_006552 [Physocladia obscura]
MMELRPLTGASFAAFGSVIQIPEPAKDASSVAVYSANQATATKYSPISILASHYPTANSGMPVMPVMSLFVCVPRKLVRKNGKQRFELSIMERHPYTTQSFIPMGLSASNSDTAYIVIVAPSLPLNTAGEDEKPDMSRARAFLAKGNQGVTYGAGVWHSPMVVLGKVSVTFAVLMWVNGVAKDECTEVEVVTEEVEINKFQANL